MDIESLSRATVRIDLAMPATRMEGGAVASRPMSDNGQVGYRGTGVFFIREGSRTVAGIEGDARVEPSFAGRWTSDLGRWSEQGPETPGVVMAAMRAERIRDWDEADDGEVAL